MSDFKFSCPHCSQHLAGDLSWSGLQVECPICQQSFTVPAAPASSNLDPVASTRAAGVTVRNVAPDIIEESGLLADFYPDPNARHMIHFEFEMPEPEGPGLALFVAIVPLGVGCRRL